MTTSGRSVAEVPPVVLEDEPDRGEHDQHEADEDQPPADREPEREDRGGQAEEQRPPAVRAEEADLPGALDDLPLRVVLWPRWQPAASEQRVEADQQAKRHRKRERRRGCGILRRVPVHDVRADEEEAAAEEEPAFDFHVLSTPLLLRSADL